MVLVTALDASEIVSTLPGGSHPQGALKLDIDLVSKAQTVHPGLCLLGDGWSGDIEEPKRKQVLFLPPDLDRANCVCREK
jgi:hypothetical protein